MNIKKPPDRYKTYKNSFKSIIKDNVLKNKIQDALIRTNKIITRTYMVLRLYLINEFDLNNDIFNNNNKDNEFYLENVIRDVITSITSEIKGVGKRRIKNQVIDNFYKENYQLYQNEKSLLDKKNLTQVLGYEITKIITCYTNAVKSNYVNNLFRFINSVFNYKEDTEYIKLKNKEDIKNFKIQHRIELREIKNDLLNGTLLSHDKYKDWIKEIRFNITPSTYDKSIRYDLVVNPLKYIKYMVYMNKYLENINKKLFQVFPMRTNIGLKSIDIDTRIIIDLTTESNRTELYNNITRDGHIYWNKYFNMKLLKDRTKYKFNNRISTDGMSVSILYVHEKYKSKKYLGGNKKQDDNFLYIDDVDYDELKNKYKNENFVYCDPGKNNLLYMIDKNDNIMRYTNSQRIKETERLKIQDQLYKMKYRNNIIKEETKLSGYNSKTMSTDNFKEYIKVKEELNDNLREFYSNERIRKFKWRSYINKQRTESKLINNIKIKYGKDVNIVIGNWSIKKQLRNFISTPCLGIKRLLSKNFNLLTIDEYRTSCLSYLDESKVENLKIKGKKIHPVLMLTQKNGSMGCISRDKNAVLNMRKIFEYYIEHKSRPINYCR